MKMEKITFQSQLENELNDIARQGGFVSVVLSDDKGLVLAMTGNRVLGNIASALSALSLSYKNTVEQEMNLEDIDEISTVTGHKYRFVNRFISINNEDSCFVISLIVPPNHPYRKLLNIVATKIKKLLYNHR